MMTNTNRNTAVAAPAPLAEGWEAVADLVAYIDSQGHWDPVLAAKLAAVRVALKTKAN